MTKRTWGFSIFSSVLLAASAALAATTPDAAAAAQPPTFYRDVAPVLQENCQACHRPAGLNMGGILAPMSLVSYEETRPRAEVLLEVPRYDFNWQTSYKYREPKVLPAGTRLDVQLWFENTAERAEAVGFSNQKAVRRGGPTTDEMDLGFFSFVYLDEEPAAATATAAGASAGGG